MMTLHPLKGLQISTEFVLNCATFEFGRFDAREKVISEAFLLTDRFRQQFQLGGETF